MKQSKSTRKRGLILTIAGLKRLQGAILAMEKLENNGHRFTLEDLGDRIKVSTKTLNRLWSLNTGVDQKTLKLCFSAFNLELCREDYEMLSEPDRTEGSQTLSMSLDTGEERLFPSLSLDSLATQHHNPLENLWSYPDGPVPVDSPSMSIVPPSRN